jgi:WXG100 family type VII secretion target
MTILLSHPDLARAVAGLRLAGDALEQRRESVEAQVECLLDGGWAGSAAASYREGWEEWRAGCREVLAALEQMADLVVAAGDGLDAADSGARDACTVLAGRLQERLG